MGTFLVYRIAGGEAGMSHFLAQFGPTLKLPWTKLEAPELTRDLIDRVSAQSDDQAAGFGIRDLERKRDDCLIAVLGGLRAQEYGAGAVLKAYERDLFARLGAVAPGRGDGASPLRLTGTRVPAEWIDYNGHMTESRYLQCFGEATDALLRRIGVDTAYLKTGRSFYTVETHLMHLGQARLDETVTVDTQVLGSAPERLRIFHALTSGGGATIATAEQMLLHVDTAAGRAVPADGPVPAAMGRLTEAHAGLPRPADAGRAIGTGRAAS